MKKLPIQTLLTDRNGRLLLIKGCAVFLVCLVSFLCALFYVRYLGAYNTDYQPDEGNYIAMAQRLLNEHVYSYWGRGPDAYVSPGYPLFLTACMAIFGTGAEGIFCIRVVQCLLSALTVLLTFLLGQMLTEKYSAGLIACLLVGGNCAFYAYSWRLLTENLYYFTMMLFFVVFVLAAKRDKWQLHLLAGACLAVSVMVRPLLVIVAPFLYLPHILRTWKRWRQMLIPMLLFAAGFVVVCIPWWVRNCITLGKLVLLATQTNPIYAGLAPNVEALGLSDPGSMGGNLLLLLRLLRDDFFGTLHWMTFGKFQIIFMSDFEMQPKIIIAFVRNITVYWGLCCGVRTLFSRKYWGPSLVFWVYLASSFLFIPVRRYSLQYFPLMAILAGELLYRVFTYRERNGQA